MKDETAVGLLAIIGVICGIPVLIILLSLLDGWVLVRMWRWFIVSTFHLPELPIWTAIGMTLIVHFLLPSRNGKETRKFAEILTTNIFGTIFAFGFAALIHWLSR